MNAPPVGVGSNPNLNLPNIDPNLQDRLQENTNNRVQQGSTTNRGVILAKDSLDVPLEYAFGITNERSEPNRPSLLPLFRTRYVEGQELAVDARNYYEELKNSLSPELKIKLDQNNRLPFEDQDPDIVALDSFLQFAADLIAIVNRMRTPVAEGDPRLEAAQIYLRLPEDIKHEMVNYVTTVTRYCDNYLATIGPNDPSYDLLLKALNQIKQALQLY